MKKITAAFFLFVPILVMASCFSTPGVTKTRNYGVYNPLNTAEENLCTLIIDPYVLVSKFNNKSVMWNRSYTRKIIKVPSGLHTFHVDYLDGQKRSTKTGTVTALLERGNTYLLKATLIMGMFLDYQVFSYNDGTVQGQAVTVNLNKLQNDLNNGGSGPLSGYIRHIINPTLDDEQSTVRLENDTHILLLEPDSAYTMTDKRTGAESRGRHGFVMNLQMTKGELFLLETDITQMSSKQFLASPYQQNAQTVLSPIACDAESVTYKYVKPAELAETEIAFTITTVPGPDSKGKL